MLRGRLFLIASSYVIFPGNCSLIRGIVSRLFVGSAAVAPEAGVSSQDGSHACSTPVSPVSDTARPDSFPSSIPYSPTYNIDSGSCTYTFHLQNTPQLTTPQLTVETEFSMIPGNFGITKFGRFATARCESQSGDVEACTLKMTLTNVHLEAPAIELLEESAFQDTQQVIVNELAALNRMKGSSIVPEFLGSIKVKDSRYVDTVLVLRSQLGPTLPAVLEGDVSLLGDAYFINCLAEQLLSITIEMFKRGVASPRLTEAGLVVSEYDDNCGTGASDQRDTNDVDSAIPRACPRLFVTDLSLAMNFPFPLHSRFFFSEQVDKLRADFTSLLERTLENHITARSAAEPDELSLTLAESIRSVSLIEYWDKLIVKAQERHPNFPFLVESTLKTL